MNEREREKEERERRVAQRFLDWYNRKHEMAFGDIRHEEPDIVCHDAQSGASMAIAVKELLEDGPCALQARRQWEVFLQDFAKHVRPSVLGKYTLWLNPGWTGHIVLPPRDRHARAQSLDALRDEFDKVAPQIAERRCRRLSVPNVGEFVVMRGPAGVSEVEVTVTSSGRPEDPWRMIEKANEQLAHFATGREAEKSRKFLLFDCRGWPDGNTRGDYEEPGLKGVASPLTQHAEDLEELLNIAEELRIWVNSDDDASGAEEYWRELHYPVAPAQWFIDEIYCLGPDWIQRRWRTEDRKWQRQTGPLEEE